MLVDEFLEHNFRIPQQYDNLRHILEKDENLFYWTAFLNGHGGLHGLGSFPSSVQQLFWRTLGIRFSFWAVPAGCVRGRLPGAIHLRN